MFFNKIYINRHEKIQIMLFNIVNPTYHSVIELLLAKLISNKLILTIIVFLL